MLSVVSIVVGGGRGIEGARSQSVVDVALGSKEILGGQVVGMSCSCRRVCCRSLHCLCRGIEPLTREARRKRDTSVGGLRSGREQGSFGVTREEKLGCKTKRTRSGGSQSPHEKESRDAIKWAR